MVHTIEMDMIVVVHRFIVVFVYLKQYDEFTFRTIKTVQVVLGTWVNIRVIRPIIEFKNKN